MPNQRFHMPFGHRLAKGIIGHPVGVIIVLALVTIGLSCHLPRLTFRTAVYDLVIENLPETQAFRGYQKKFGADDLIRIVATTNNVFDPATFQQLAILSQRVGEVAGVRRVISLPEIKRAIDVAGEHSLDAFATLIEPVSLFDKNLISADRRRTILTLALTTTADREAVIEDLGRILDEGSQQMPLYQIGIPLVSQALDRMTRQDFFRIPPMTLLVIALLLWLLYRNTHCLRLSLACVAMSLVWTFGLMAINGVPLTMLTMIVPVFLIAVGTAYCLHVCSDYLSSVHQTDTPAHAALATLTRIALPITLAVVTTLIGIGSLLISKIGATREFALAACFAMGCLWLITLTLLPALMALMPLPQSHGTGHSNTGFMARVLKAIAHIDLKHQRIVLPAIGLLVMVCIVGMFRLQVETNPLQYFGVNTDTRRHFNDIYTDLSGSFPVNVVLESPEEDYFESPAHLAGVARLQAFMNTLPGVDKTVSLVDYLKLVNYASNRYAPETYALPEEDFELRMLINNFKSLLGEDLLRQFMTPTFSAANVLLLTHISKASDFLSLRKQIADELNTTPYQAIRGEVTGFSMALSASSRVLTTGQIKSLSISLVLIFCIMFMMFLSTRVGIIAIIPNCFPIIVNFGLMGWLGIPLSIATSLIASVAIGLAVDDTVHYLVRYNREFRKDLDKDRALRDTIRHVGKPIIHTTLIIGLGFSILVFSNFQPTALFGMLMVVTMITALVGDLVLLPSLMRHVELVTAWDLLRMIPTLGGMSAGMIHELNQPLNAIKMGSDFLKMITRQEQAVPTDQLYEVADEIGRQVDRASEMIHRLGELNDQPDFSMEPIDINTPVRDTVAIVKQQLSLENIHIETDLAVNLPPISGRKSRLSQVVYNLVTNAGEAIVDRQKTERETAMQTIRIQTYAEKNRVLLVVSDPGSGIPADLMDRVTEPFFTTKEPGEGKGLGLAITQEIIKTHQGRMTIESTVGKGTSVRLSFPAQPDK